MKWFCAQYSQTDSEAKTEPILAELSQEYQSFRPFNNQALYASQAQVESIKSGFSTQ